MAHEGARARAGVFKLWALGVGAVISGDFFGWQWGLVTGGTGGMLLATAVVCVMYVGLCFSLAELSAALSSPLGTTAWAARAFGPWGGLLVGVSTTLEYVLTAGVVNNAIGQYVTQLAGLSAASQPLCWIGSYVVAIAINTCGGQMFLNVQTLITLVSLTVLMVFFVTAPLEGRWSSCWLFCADPSGLNCSALGADAVPVPTRKTAASTVAASLLPTQLSGQCNASSQAAGLLPLGVSGMIASLPYAVWLFLAIEELPLAVDEARDPVKDIPRALSLGIVTLSITGCLTVLMNAGVAPGAAGIGLSQAPLLDGYRAVFAVSDEGNGRGLIIK